MENNKLQQIGRKIRSEKIRYNLLTNELSNAKLAKNAAEDSKYLSAILHLWPGKLCPFATIECLGLCLNTSGMAGIIKKGETTNVILEARKRRTRLWYTDRTEFFRLLYIDIRKLLDVCDIVGKIPVIRMDGTQDIAFELTEIKPHLATKYAEQFKGRNLADLVGLNPNTGQTVFQDFPDVQGYDYTKWPFELRPQLPNNFHLTFSYSGENDLEAQTCLDNGRNVCIVVDKRKNEPLPSNYNGYYLTDGDKSDLRFLDPFGYVAVRGKGKAATTLKRGRVDSQFVVSL